MYAASESLWRSHQLAMPLWGILRKRKWIKSSLEEAQKRWGYLDGESDSFLKKIENDYKTLVTGEKRNIEIDYQKLKIDVTAKGCENNEMYVPAQSSIMREPNPIAPAFNPVERRRIDEVMAVFESSPKEGYSRMSIMEQRDEVEKESVREYKRWRNKLGNAAEIEENVEQSQSISEKIDDSVADYNWFWFAGFGVLVLIVLIIIVVFAVFKTRRF